MSKRRESARERLARVQAEQARRRRRRVWLAAAGAAVVVIGAAVGITLAVTGGGSGSALPLAELEISTRASGRRVARGRLGEVMGHPADAVAWLRRGRHERRRYGVIVADVPAFSNSAAMAHDFDVQRDHVALVEALRALLEPDGELYFSTNLRSFALDRRLVALDPALARDSSVEDIGGQVRAPDFRDPRVHVAFRVTA